ncbi:MAG: hypothetical protein NC489_08535 [Ruminococcus flavefaciens]|nr:hypothetical protein [Ruminococcus flavefaciens]
MGFEAYPNDYATPNPSSDLFRTLWPGMVQHTRLLLVDYDVCRYHTFDMLRWQLMVDSTKTHNMEHFMSIREDLHPLLNGSTDWADQAQFAQVHVDKPNIYQLFSKSAEGAGAPDARDSRIAYEKKINEMFQNRPQRITPTDVASRFGIVFERPDITGYLMQFKEETHHPDFYDQVNHIAVNHVLSAKVIVAVVKQFKINAIMIGSSELALKVAADLINSGYKSPITFIIGRYAYNYQKDTVRNKLVPLFNAEMGELEIGFKYEFGFFEPFTGLAYKDFLKWKSLQDLEEDIHAE